MGLAPRIASIEFTVGIEGTADVEWPRRLDQVVHT